MCDRKRSTIEALRLAQRGHAGSAARRRDEGAGEIEADHSGVVGAEAALPAAPNGRRSRLNGERIAAGGNSFTVQATPSAVGSSGQRSFCTDDTTVIRFNLSGALIPAPCSTSGMSALR